MPLHLLLLKVVNCDSESKEYGEIVQRTTFLRRDYHSVRMLVFAIQAFFPRPGRIDGRTRISDESYDDHAFGIREVPEFENRWNHFTCKAGKCWRIDETCVNILGRLGYLYRAVGIEGNTVYFRLSPKRNLDVAKALLRRAVRTQCRLPLRFTLDGYAALHRALREILAESKAWDNAKIRSSKYPNNMTEQDHRDVNSCIRPMLFFKVFDRVVAMISGIELIQRIRKGKFALGYFRIQGKTSSTIFNAVLSN